MHNDSVAEIFGFFAVGCEVGSLRGYDIRGENHCRRGEIYAPRRKQRETLSRTVGA